MSATKSGVTFWQMPAEEAEFLSFLNSTGDMLAYTAAWKEKPEDVRAVPLVKLIKQENPCQLMFGPKSGTRRVEAHSFEGRVLHNVRLETSDLMMYRRGQLKERILTQSNIGVLWTYVDDQKQPMRKGPEFVSWSRRVLAWVRKRTQERHEQSVQFAGRGSYRLTRLALAAFQQGEIDLKLY